MVEAALLNRGWHLSKEGLERCKNGVPDTKAESIMQKALDIDLRQIGLPAVPTDIGKGKVDKIQGPMVLQIQKIRNVSAPKANEDSGIAPPLLRLQLTDGHTTVMALVLSSIAKIGLSTPPGSKLKITGSVAFSHGFLLLTTNNSTYLGGNVEELVQRWQLAKSLYHHTRSAVSGAGGPPPWVPFGQRSRQGETSQKSARITVKKSLEDPKPKEQTEQDKEFAEQRKAAIQEVNKSKQSQGKTFGGTKTTTASQVKDSRDSGRRGLDNSHRDSGRFSRKGDQSDGQAAAAKPRSDGIYRDLNYGGYQPDEKAIQQLVSMGFKRDAASNALRKHTGNVDTAIEMLLKEQSGPSQPQPQASGRQRPDNRLERSYGNGRRGRRGDEEEEASAPPTAPATLFDFLQPKLGKDNERGSQPSVEAAASQDSRRPRNFAKEQPNSVREAGITFVHGKEKGQSSNYKQPEQQQGYRRRDNNDGQNKRDYNQRAGSGRGNSSSARNYTENDDRGRDHDRSYGNREKSNYRDRTSNRERHDDNRRSNSYPQKRDNTRDDDLQNQEERGYQRDSGYRGREKLDRKIDYKPRDYQDNRPPRFQRQNNSQSENARVSQRKEMREDGSKTGRDMERSQHARNQFQPSQQSNHDPSFGVMQPPPLRPNLNPGDVCQAKYWEDNRFYNAILTAIHPSGKTCVVLFPEYGNHEEVKITDVRPAPSQAWMNPSHVPAGQSVPPLLMSANGGMYEGSTNTHLEFRQGGEGTVYNGPRQPREPRKNTRPSQTFYQPPGSRN